jgi:hypothetical protein
VPLALIPQLILAGVIVPALPEPGVLFSQLSISAYWLTEGMTDLYIRGAEVAPQTFDAATRAPVPLEAQSVYYAIVMLTVHLLTCLGAAIKITNRRFSRDLMAPDSFLDIWQARILAKLGIGSAAKEVTS